MPTKSRRLLDEPETRVGICCGCRADSMALYRIPGLYRYRCDECFERETGHRHYLAPRRPPPRIVIP